MLLISGEGGIKNEKRELIEMFYIPSRENNQAS